MSYIIHLLFFAIAALVIWLVAGSLIDIIDRIAKRFNRSSFTLSFFVLGVLTSLSEISVAINASFTGVPQVSVGNLIGASLVLAFLVIPLLAFFGKGIRLVDSFSRPIIALWGLVVLLPAAVILDGFFSLWEAAVLLCAFAMLLFAMRARRGVVDVVHDVEETVADTLGLRKYTVYDGLKLGVGALIIFIAARVLVSEVIFFADAFRIPASFIALMVLAFGTNVPELVVAVRSIQKKEKDIAFGDYMGSAATNTAIFAGLGFLNGSFTVEQSEFVPTFVLLTLGLFLFMFFANSRRTISEREAVGLFLVYGTYVVIQGFTMFQFLRS